MDIEKSERKERQVVASGCCVALIPADLDGTCCRRIWFTFRRELIWRSDDSGLANHHKCAYLVIELAMFTFRDL